MLKTGSVWTLAVSSSDWERAHSQTGLITLTIHHSGSVYSAVVIGVEKRPELKLRITGIVRYGQ